MFKVMFYMTVGILFHYASAQPKGGIEQYNYVNNSGVSTLMPVVHFETKNGWHSEGRYNYEELKTFSFYFGKSFSRDGSIAWTVTPMAGFLVGNLKGLSAALNVNFEYSNIFLASQPQFVVAMDKVNQNFFYNWSELGYNVRKWLFAGVTIQQTITGSASEGEPGLMLGFNAGKFSFPIYFFKLGRQDNYLILGVNWEWN